MTNNKGKPSQQKADERLESEGNHDPRSPRSVHRLDRSRSVEKGGKGATPRRTAVSTVRGSAKARGA
jgi:Ulp1 family protease